MVAIRLPTRQKSLARQKIPLQPPLEKRTNTVQFKTVPC
jgi:hypothetical protein